MNVSKWSGRPIDLAPTPGAACLSDAYGNGLSFGALQAHRHLDPGVFVSGMLDAADPPSRPGALGRDRATGGLAAEVARDDTLACDLRYGAGPA
jgi:hypothetical protein